ncbi:hypothetical protein QR680_004647 [Steinernema hermaphroditum]|uniref:Uncharacterized protein n=1 Tax=Steinernema hermaphroditum TaxID=289476 RepID=A0AA39HRK1_9BILA|nr:hypothetical protein QR680_004647 [Steinernema hermaphroditum]
MWVKLSVFVLAVILGTSLCSAKPAGLGDATNIDLMSGPALQAAGTVINTVDTAENTAFGLSGAAISIAKSTGDTAFGAVNSAAAATPLKGKLK